MKIKTTIFFLICILNVFSQADVNYVKFIDKDTRQPLLYTIISKNGKMLAVSNEEGLLDLSLIECDSSDLVISNYGYNKISINCVKLKESHQIEMTSESQILNAVELNFQEVSPTLKKMKKQKHEKFYAQYYFKVKKYNKKHKLFLLADVIVNIYDTGKESKHPYKIKFVAKRIKILKSLKKYFYINKFNLENELMNLLWMNKPRIDKTYKENSRYVYSVLKKQDTTFINYQMKENNVTENKAQILLLRDTVFLFNAKYAFKKSVVSAYKESVTSKKPTTLIVEKVPNYTNIKIDYSKTKKYKNIPILFAFDNKKDYLVPTKRIKYDEIYTERTMIFIKDLDINLVKKTKFHKKGDLLDSLPINHPYLDTINLSFKK
jgi:hypothetical protein